MLPVKLYPDDRDSIVFLLLPLAQYRRDLRDHSGINCVGEQAEVCNQSLAGQPC